MPKQGKNERKRGQIAFQTLNVAEIRPETRLNPAYFRSLLGGNNTKGAVLSAIKQAKYGFTPHLWLGSGNIGSVHYQPTR
jgi:hypothetical protein